MNFTDILKDLNEDLYIIEFIYKDDENYKIKSHKSNKILGKKDGYNKKKDAIKALLGLKSKGGFYNKTPREQEKMIKSYITNHKM